MSINNTKNIMIKNIDNPNTIAAATFQLCFEDRKCSRLLYALLFHAILEPFTPNQILIPKLMMANIGAIIPNPRIVMAKDIAPKTSWSKDMYTLLKTPQIHPKKKAPQFHFDSSRST